MKRAFLVVVLMLFSTVGFSQERFQDVIYLKNGNVLRGTIIEQVPSEYIKLKTTDGSEFIFAISEIEKITKEENPVYLIEEKIGRRGYVGVTIGISIPMGEFEDPANGAAENGVQINLINGGFVFNEKFGLGFTWFGAANPLTYPGYDPWSYGGFMAGPIFSTTMSDKLAFDSRLLLGYFNATVPDVGIGEENVGGFGLVLGGVLRLNLSSGLALLVTIDYLSASLEFPRHAFRQQFTVISLNGGLAWRLF